MYTDEFLNSESEPPNHDREPKGLRGCNISSKKLRLRLKQNSRSGVLVGAWSSSSKCPKTQCSPICPKQY